MKKLIRFTDRLIDEVKYQAVRPELSTEDDHICIRVLGAANAVYELECFLETTATICHRNYVARKVINSFIEIADKGNILVNFHYDKKYDLYVLTGQEVRQFALRFGFKYIIDRSCGFVYYSIIL